jgi:hypothetical protein
MKFTQAYPSRVDMPTASASRLVLLRGIHCWILHQKYCLKGGIIKASIAVYEQLNGQGHGAVWQDGWTLMWHTVVEVNCATQCPNTHAITVRRMVLCFTQLALLAPVLAPWHYSAGTVLPKVDPTAVGPLV